MTETLGDTCRCGHDRSLHDAHGCAAFLGSFPDTAHLQFHCPCRLPSGAAVTTPVAAAQSTSETAPDPIPLRVVR